MTYEKINLAKREDNWYEFDTYGDAYDAYLMCTDNCGEEVEPEIIFEPDTETYWFHLEA
jgi:hypothetical protein